MPPPNSAFQIVVLISGKGSNLAAIIDAVKSGQIKGSIAAVVSNREDAGGLTIAADAGINCQVIDHKGFTDREAFDAHLISLIDPYKPQLIVLAGFMRILSSLLVNHYSGKMINIHPSLLPKYKGLDTHQRVVDDKESEHGCTVHMVSSGVDEGAIIAQSKLKLANNENPESLKRRVEKLEHVLYPKIIQLISENKLELAEGKVHMNGTIIPETGKLLSEL